MYLLSPSLVAYVIENNVTSLLYINGRVACCAGRVYYSVKDAALCSTNVVGFGNLIVARTHTHTHLCMYTHIYIHTPKHNIHTPTYIYIYIHTHTHAYVN